jgi:hypothetical protein
MGYPSVLKGVFGMVVMAGRIRTLAPGKLLDDEFAGSGLIRLRMMICTAISGALCEAGHRFIVAGRG